MMIMMSSITKVFNKSAKRNFHQRESQQEDKIATIYYDIEEKEGNEEMSMSLRKRTSFRATFKGLIFPVVMCIVYGQRLLHS